MKQLLVSGDALFDEARKDLAFDMTNADVVSLRIPSLMQKYAHLLITAKAHVRKLEIQTKEKYAELFEHYTTNHNRRIDRRDVETYIEGNTEYVKLQMEIEPWKLKVDYLNVILSALEKASWNIGNAIKLHMFRGGAS